MMTNEKATNPSIPEIAVLGSTSSNELPGGRNQYQIPTRSRRTVRIAGPTPQYHAEKTTASHAVWYALSSPNIGASALRRSRALTPARIARPYRRIPALLEDWTSIEIRF